MGPVEERPVWSPNLVYTTNFHGPMEPVLHDKEHASSCKYQPSFSFTKHGMLDIQAQCTSCIQPLQPCKLLIKEFAKHATGNCGAWGTCASRNFWLQTVTKRQTVFTGHFWKQAIKHNSLANSKLLCISDTSGVPFRYFAACLSSSMSASTGAASFVESFFSTYIRSGRSGAK